MDQSTERVLSLFKEIAAVPRKSKEEKLIAEWLRAKAQSSGWEVNVDEKLNVIISVPGKHCPQGTPTVVLQGHTDMVCEKTPESKHDFSADPIEVIQDGDWLCARGTTLGADNGIAIAIALDIALDLQAATPPMELVFTSDEEQGMQGAKALTEKSFSGRTLINIDSEDEGVFTVGCAGGAGCVLEWKPDVQPTKPEERAFEVTVSGLTGGHSGVDIHKPLANANILLARTLSYLADEHHVRIASMNGGSARNAIARNARAVVVGDTVELSDALLAAFRDEYPGEGDLQVTIADADPSDVAMTFEATQQALSCVHSLPHGVQRMSQDIEGLVETSCNLATTCFDKGTVTVAVSCRSSLPSALEHLNQKIEAVCRLLGASVKVENRYPAWQPAMGSELLSLCSDAYASLFGKDPVVEVIHAGLECGVLGERIPGMDMISLGPKIKGAHSPDERLNIPSVEKVSTLLREILARICSS